MERSERERKYTICHPVVFAMVMRDQQLCRELLQRILPERKIREIRFIERENDALGYGDPGHVETEKTVQVGLESKAVRLDVLFEDDAAWYDIEMQVQNVNSPAKRSRYYHAVKTVDSFRKGQLYESLKPGYVIFICMFDLMEKNEPMYRFEMRDEKFFLPLNDGQVTIFLNGKCSGEVPEDLKPFYLYLQTGEVRDDDAFVARIDSAVKGIIHNEGVQYQVTVYDEIEMWKNALEEKKAEFEAAQEEMQAVLQAKKAEAEAAQKEAEAAQKEAEAAQKEMLKARKLNQLTSWLLAEGRMEDALRVQEDESYRQTLMEELHL